MCWLFQNRRQKILCMGIWITRAPNGYWCLGNHSHLILKIMLLIFCKCHWLALYISILIIWNIYRFVLDLQIKVNWSYRRFKCYLWNFLYINEIQSDIETLTVTKFGPLTPIYIISPSLLVAFSSLNCWFQDDFWNEENRIYTSLEIHEGQCIY